MLPGGDTGMVWRRAARTGLPVLVALLIVAGLVFHARLSEGQRPPIQKGLLNLTQWDGKQVFALAGEWEFYWDKLLGDELIKSGSQAPMLVDAPKYWDKYQINGVNLPGKGQATYRIHITGAKAGVRYGARLQSAGYAYRLYVDGVLVAYNGSFGDTETAPSSAYRPQLADFTPAGGSFDLVLQVSNDVYGVGGMWDSVLFGTYSQIVSYNRLLSYTVVSAMAGLIVSCLFFLIFFTAQRGEKDALILSVLVALMLVRFSLIGDVLLTAVFPNLPVAWLSKVDFLTMPWAQFLLLYFLYCTYGRLVRKWQVWALFLYTVAVSLFILLFPLHTTTSAYMLMNGVLLAVMVTIAAQLVCAAWQGREGAPLLLFAVLLILSLICYELFVPDWSTGYYLLNNSGFEYLMFIFAQMAVVALRYRRAQRLEIAHLKGQIRPHFIHNALTSIISISRSEPERARELLVDFSSYLRGFYDYERDELVSISQELELVHAYVALEQARFGEKLRAEYRIDAEDFLLPPLILQPLVENAFVHGLRAKEDGGIVTVYAMRVKNGKVRIGVRDNGIGLSASPASARRGVAIENINRRLSRLYRTSLVYLVPEGGGCEARFEIPCKEVAARHEGLAD